MYLGTHDINDGDGMKLGGSQVDKMMLGTEQVWINNYAADAPTLFVASNDDSVNINFSWVLPIDQGVPVCTYSIRNSSNAEVATAVAGATSATYVTTATVSEDFTVVAVNLAGESLASNSDNGSSHHFAGWKAVGEAKSTEMEFPDEWYSSLLVSADGVNFQYNSMFNSVLVESAVCVFTPEGNLTDGDYFISYEYYGLATNTEGFRVLNNQITSFVEFEAYDPPLYDVHGVVTFDPATGLFSGETYAHHPSDPADWYNLAITGTPEGLYLSLAPSYNPSTTAMSVVEI